MIPLHINQRRELWRRPEFLPGLAQHWGDERDEPVPIRAKRTEPTQATVNLGLYAYRWEPDPKDHPVLEGMLNDYGHRDLIVLRGLIFHDEDYGISGFDPVDRLDSHKGDSEAFVIVYTTDAGGIGIDGVGRAADTGRGFDSRAVHQTPQTAPYRPVLLLTRSHYLFLLYSKPSLVDGRLWLEVERGGHAITHAPTLESMCGKSVRLYLPNINLAIRDMESDDFRGWEPEYRRMFAEWRIDWPDQMGDRRVEISRWYRGDSVGYAWNDPMEFAYRLRRCVGKQ